MKEDEVSETIGAIGILIMLLILVILGINHFVGPDWYSLRHFL